MNYFLNREGRTSGPYDEMTIQQWRASGEILKYSWLWDPSQNQWAPAYPAPEAPGQPVPRVRAPAPAPGPAVTPALAPAATFATDGLMAICHDYRNVLSGKLIQATEPGCVFRAPHSQTQPLPFRSGSWIWLNLLEETSGRSENVKVQVTQVSRATGNGEESYWDFELQWKSVPGVLAGKK